MSRWRLPGNLHDWVNVALAGCALIVSIVSLWTTTQVSGVQDYLQSEIRRRNNELNNISSRSGALERAATDRAEQLASLQVSTDALQASAVDAQRRFSVAQGDLAKVRADALAAELTLSRSRLAESAARAEMQRQAGEFDIFARNRAWDYATLEMAFALGLPDDPPSGQAAVDAIAKLRPPADQPKIAESFDLMKRQVPNACPALPSWKARTTPLPVKPLAPNLVYPPGASRADLARITQEAQAKLSADYTAYFTALDAQTQARIDDMRDLGRVVNRCLCDALADEKVPTSRICPSLR